MSKADIIDNAIGRTPDEARDKLAELLSVMTPEYYVSHMKHMQDMAWQAGQDRELEEIVCRLLASGMPVEEIAVILCLRVDAVRMIEHNNAAIKIPDYIKKLKERRRRREKQST